MLRTGWSPIILLLSMAILFVACDGSDQVSPEQITSAVDAPAAPDRVLPTLYPTATAVPTVTATNTRPPEATEIVDTPVAFDQTVVDIQYVIPALGLERRVRANVSNQIQVINEVTGDLVVRRNQPTILLELQQAVSEVTLDELPADCDRCVQLAYELPMADVTEAGWLADPRLMASIENFTSVYLGPHFPEGTVVGLRRSATESYPAHTIALTDEGQLWLWTATQSEIPEPVVLESTNSELFETFEELGEIDLSELSDSYAIECPHTSGTEFLFIAQDQDKKLLVLECPHLSLPSTLAPVYQELDVLTTDVVTYSTTVESNSVLPLASLLYYQRSDGSSLTLMNDDAAIAIDSSGVVFTGTITKSLTISLTTELINSGGLELGVESLLQEERPPNLLVVRGKDGVYEAVWDEPDNSALEVFFPRIDALIDRLLGTSTELTGTETAGTPPPSTTAESTKTP